MASSIGNLSASEQAAVFNHLPIDAACNSLIMSAFSDFSSFKSSNNLVKVFANILLTAEFIETASDKVIHSVIKGRNYNLTFYEASKLINSRPEIFSEHIFVADPHIYRALTAGSAFIMTPFNGLERLLKALKKLAGKTLSTDMIETLLAFWIRSESFIRTSLALYAKHERLMASGSVVIPQDIPDLRDVIKDNLKKEFSERSKLIKAINRFKNAESVTKLLQTPLDLKLRQFVNGLREDSLISQFALPYVAELSAFEAIEKLFLAQLTNVIIDGNDIWILNFYATILPAPSERDPIDELFFERAEALIHLHPAGGKVEWIEMKQLKVFEKFDKLADTTNILALVGKVFNGLSSLYDLMNLADPKTIEFIMRHDNSCLTTLRLFSWMLLPSTIAAWLDMPEGVKLL